MNKYYSFLVFCPQHLLLVQILIAFLCVFQLIFKLLSSSCILKNQMPLIFQTMQTQRQEYLFSLLKIPRIGPQKNKNLRDPFSFDEQIICGVFPGDFPEFLIANYFTILCDLFQICANFLSDVTFLKSCNFTFCLFHKLIFVTNYTRSFQFATE